MDLEECKRKGYIKRTTKNLELINSLLEMSDSKEITVNEANINEISISTYISVSYDSLREVLEALCISFEYKVTSHICIGQLLKTLIKDFDFETFDRLRWTRNSINYYGNKIELEQGLDFIKKIFEMKKEILNLYFK